MDLHFYDIECHDIARHDICYNEINGFIYIYNYFKMMDTLHMDIWHITKL
jgi:hypothetical protein